MPDGEQVVQPINDLLKLPFTLKIATKDWHPKRHISFASTHKGRSNCHFSADDYGTSFSPERRKIWLSVRPECWVKDVGIVLGLGVVVSKIEDEGGENRTRFWQAWEDRTGVDESQTGLNLCGLR